MTIYVLLGHTFKRIYKNLTPRLQKRTIILFVWMFALAVLELASIILLTFFFRSMSHSHQILTIWFIKDFLDANPGLAEFLADQRHFMLVLSCLPVGAIALKNTLNPIVKTKISKLSQEVSAYIGIGIMRHYLYMPYKWHLSSQSGEAFNKMNWRNSVSQTLIEILTIYSNVLTVSLLMCGLLLIAPAISILSVSFMGGTGFLTFGLIRKNIDKHSKLGAKHSAEERYATMAAVNGIQEVLIYQQQEAFLETVQVAIKKGVPNKTFLQMAPPIPSWTLETAGFSLILIVISFMTYVLDAPPETILSNVALLALTAWRVLPSLNRIVGSTVGLRAQVAMFEPCLSYFESLRAQAPGTPAAPDPNFRVGKEVHLDNVSFYYPSSKEAALKNIRLTIEIGQSIGIVGISGSGKSTLINILTGLLLPDEGELTVDGERLTPSKLTSYRSRIGYVAQRPFLLPGTVAANIAFSQWGKEYDAQRVRKACQMACIDFLGPECKQINRRVGNQGAGFSGGQAQRICIARALYPSPDILILDEATSSLDLASESSIQNSLKRLKGQITTIIAAHRLSTLDICDTIIWMKNGSITRVGTPDEILPTYTEWLKKKAADGDIEAQREMKEMKE
jgi:ABC-type multidrug transport system fused ATPase/permease subunit